MNETFAVIILSALRIILPLVILLAIGGWLHWRQEKINRKNSR